MKNFEQFLGRLCVTQQKTFGHKLYREMKHKFYNQYLFFPCLNGVGGYQIKGECARRTDKGVYKVAESSSVSLPDLYATHDPFVGHYNFRVFEQQCMCQPSFSLRKIYGSHSVGFI